MPAPHLDTATVFSLVEDAVTAPSLHNAQPWKFIFRPAQCTLELHADPERAMPHTDPHHRGLLIGCAAALFNLRVAASHAGWATATRLLTSPDNAWHLAEVELREDTPPDHELASLHPALRRRHTSRSPFTDEKIPAALWDGLRAAALREGARLLPTTAWHTEHVLRLVRESERREATDPDARAETARWTRAGAADEGPTTDGLPAHAFGPRQAGMSSTVRDVGSWWLVPSHDSAAFEHLPQIALLGTAGDTQTDWLRAGQAMERVLLQATQDGLVSSLISQPLEWPELRWAVRDPKAAMSHVQMVIRFGYGPEGAATPRRPVHDVLSVL
ncbi:Acg family FMN-binding oxidoreductase [Streptomyces sp. NPDC085929]|uniref:Acg family FMN-binding oxidoreductase n=1 Tax=Streptomyces sp. NPDC085929 TaxID=3365739 RepID=UPI0037D269A6